MTKPVLTRMLEDATIDGKKDSRSNKRKSSNFGSWIKFGFRMPRASIRPLQLTITYAARFSWLRTSRSRRKLNLRLRDAVNQLKADVLEYDWFVRLSFDMEKALAARRESYYAADPANIDVFNIYGLLRFGIPEKFHRKVRESVRALLGVGQEAQASAFASFVSTCRDAVRSRVESQAIANALCALWILGLDRHWTNCCRPEANLSGYRRNHG